ncbi:hypothetical protein NRIC_12320 [Enterococcus florum]|uniref:Type VII secretion system protein EssD-like domain-containing protein n=1 Tax=Enterococcus florum TaxID=2480627 RepID=A0A4P5PAQ5_9ENTE|nr:DNA/RNA non-specific endonuclease [Enterococcus florum]GCF93341.1 hypothetical protein NRIC_12320 [Enterococcus florum]
MKKLSVLLVVCSALLFSACSNDKNAETADSSTKQTTTERLKKENDDQKLKDALESRIKQNEELANLSYADQQTIDVNDGKPTFTDEELSIKAGAWEKYGDLDELNRATYAEALLNKSLMPTEKRSDISNVEPTGWHSKKIGDSYLYNRSHLIGFALSGENANWKNLITGTQQLNNPEMLRFEMDIKTYLEKSEDNYVRYSVIPVFKDDELLARGVHMQGKSIDSDDISFNVFIFNIQDNVEIDYADGTSRILSQEQEQQVAPPPQTEQTPAQDPRIGQILTSPSGEQHRVLRILPNGEQVIMEATSQADYNNDGILTYEELCRAEEGLIQQAAEAEARRAADEANSHHAEQSQSVFITPTGSKYHSHQCGNGTYSPSTLEHAQSIGLTPCERCY